MAPQLFTASPAVDRQRDYRALQWGRTRTPRTGLASDYREREIGCVGRRGDSGHVADAKTSAVIVVRASGDSSGR